MEDPHGVAEKIEREGFCVGIIDEQDEMYEDDLRRIHKQNLSAHNWEEAEYEVLRKYYGSKML